MDKHIDHIILNNSLNQLLRKQSIQKAGWGISLLIAVCNGATQGLLGFPNIGTIASIDNISITTGFPLTERIFMMIVTGLMMIPFFKQLVVRCVSYTMDHNILEIRNRIIKESLRKPDSVRSQLKHHSYWIDFSYYCVLAIILGVGSAYIISLGTGYLLPVIGILIVHYIAHKYIENMVTNKIKLQLLKRSKKLDEKIDQPKLESFVTKYASRRRTQRMIQDAARKLRAIRTEQPTAQAMSKALCYSIYQAQLQRFRHASYYGHEYTSMKIEYLQSDSSSDIQTLYKALTPLDTTVLESPLYQFERNELLDPFLSAQRELDTDGKQALQTFQATLRPNNINRTSQQYNVLPDAEKAYFNIYITNLARQAFRSNWSINGTNPEIKAWMEANKDGYPCDTHELIQKALQAEIEEEKYLQERFFQSGTAQYKVNQKDRFIDHAATENSWILSNYTPSKWRSWIGEIMGTFNALVNAGITAAVTTTMIQTLIPLIFGITITNPWIIGCIIIASAIAGFTSSYSITRIAIMKNIKAMGTEKIAKQIVKQTQLQKPLTDRLIEGASIIGGIGLGVLSAIKVHNLALMYFGTNIAIAAGVIVAVTTFVAVYSLFYEYNKASYANDQKDTRYLKAFFPVEYNNNQKIQHIKWHERVIGISAALLTGLLIMANTGTIVVASTTAIGALYLTKLVLAAFSTRNAYKKPNQAIRNLLAESGLTLTLVHGTCLCVSVSLGIASILGSTLLSSGISIVIGVIVTSLYGQYVWRTSTMPDLTMDDPITQVVANDEQNRISTIHVSNKQAILYSLILATCLSLTALFFLTGTMIFVGVGASCILTDIFYYSLIATNNISYNIGDQVAVTTTTISTDKQNLEIKGAPKPNQASSAEMGKKQDIEKKPGPDKTCCTIS